MVHEHGDDFFRIELHGPLHSTHMGFKILRKKEFAQKRFGMEEEFSGSIQKSGSYTLRTAMSPKLFKSDKQFLARLKEDFGF